MLRTAIAATTLQLTTTVLVVTGDAGMLTLEHAVALVEPFLAGESPKGMFEP